MVSILRITFLTLVLSILAGTARAEPGITATTISLGQSIFLTGGLAALGQDLRAGAQLFFDDLNLHGGIHGRRVTLTTMDDGYDPARAKSNIERLLREGSFAIFQLPGTGAVSQVAPMLEKAGVPLCAAMGTGPELRAVRYDWTFYVRASNTREIRAIVAHLQTIGRNRVGVIYLDAAYGTQGRDVAAAEIPARGLTYIGAWAVPRDTADDAPFTSAATALAAQRPDATILITAGKSSVSAVTAMRRTGVPTNQIYGLASALTDNEVSLLGSSAEGLIVSQLIPDHSRTSHPTAIAFRAAAQRTGILPNRAIFEGWLNAAVCAAGLEHAGPNPTRAGFRHALESIDIDLAGMRVRFDPIRRDGSSYVDLTYVTSQGKFLK